jgi:N-acetyl-gamma-glutamyl-phosphate reductase
MPEKKKIGIVGATGYTGSELVRILTLHPEIEIAAITSQSRAGEAFSDVHPFLQGIADQRLSTIEELGEHELDLVFLALPHGVSMDFVQRFAGSPFKIIDLSGDFRLGSALDYEKWYQKPHTYPEGLEQAVFGCPELFGTEIAAASLVANPGCFPTSAILGLAPLLAGGLIEPGPIIVDSKSGVTGAGVKPGAVNLFSNVNDNFKAYGLKRHRHTIEMQGVLDRWSGQSTLIQFTPHLLPLDRGILTTIYARAAAPIATGLLRGRYEGFYAEAPFVRLRQEAPTLKDVRGSNYCDLYATYDRRTGMVLVISVIDNLIKGAAGQAVQNMNLLFGFDEALGLRHIPLNP